MIACVIPIANASKVINIFFFNQRCGDPGFLKKDCVVTPVTFTDVTSVLAKKVILMEFFKFEYLYWTVTLIPWRRYALSEFYSLSQFSLYLSYIIIISNIIITAATINHTIVPMISRGDHHRYPHPQPAIALRSAFPEQAEG